MQLNTLELKNWRNFKSSVANLSPITYVIGANASGKSNLFDALRFLRDIAKPRGGGLQKAVEMRGGLGKVRCLHARRDTEVGLHLNLSDEKNQWAYTLGFDKDAKPRQDSVAITREMVIRNSELLLNRPDQQDKEDPQLLTETYLEQTRSNGLFREIAEFLKSITYLHLVPQLLKYDHAIGGRTLEDDPFGQGFLDRIASCPARTRDSRLTRIGKVLAKAVPQFGQLRFVSDPRTGRPHLEANYLHHGRNGNWEREEQFSYGTLRLIGILWSLFENKSLLLLEEPELSLNQEVIRRIPKLMHDITQKQPNRCQLLISTHSDALLSNPGIDPNSILILHPSEEGTKIRNVTPEEKKHLDAGLSAADILLPQTNPQGATQLSLFE